MIHYIFNTGQTYGAARVELDRKIAEKLQEYIRPGAYSLPVPGNLVLDVMNLSYGYAGTLFWGETAIIAFGVADTPEVATSIWPGLEKMYLEITGRGMLACWVLGIFRLFPVHPWFQSQVLCY